jgi:predicted nucleic acid-binding protein
MTIVVDANIVFSALLNTNSKIGDLLINSSAHFSFIAPEFLLLEIQKHYPRLQRFTGQSIAGLKETESRIYRDVAFIPEYQISHEHWQRAAALVADVDENDTPYVALAMQFDCSIWSGDKALMQGLAAKRFMNFMVTDELFRLREELRRQ